jgi:methylated-DNA-protein-cysteine methyltransferase-like protein
MNQKLNFYAQVYQQVKQIPYGKVASYGQIASLISTPRAARAVGWALRALNPKTNVPWHRVVNRQGRVSIINPQVSKLEQVKRLQAEGVIVKQQNKNFYLDLKHYLWQD